MKKKRIFITGAAGFIGFHLARALNARHDRVLGLDNFNAYYSPLLKAQRAEILHKEGIDLVTGDICEKEPLRALIEQFEPTHIVHLAAQAGVRHALNAPFDYISANLEGFTSILEVSRHMPHVPLIYASSSSVYGTNTKIPFSESDVTDHPANLYGATKKSNELMAYAYHHLFQIPMTGLRFFTVYGPYGRPDMAYFSFAEAILDKRPLPVFNKGQMLRDFTYIDDIVTGTIAAIDLSAPFEIFNLGNHQPQPLMHLISLLENFLGEKAQIQYQTMPQGDIITTFADITHSAQKLGFTPKISLDEGVEKFVQWFLQWKSSI